MMSFSLVEYDPHWPAQFEEEKKLLLGVAHDFIEDIQHFGSTSIPGMCAKPKIDILIGLKDLSLVERCIEPFQALDYLYGGEDAPGRYYFRKPFSRESVSTHHLHLVAFASEQWFHPLLFRDYLRKHPEVAWEYADCKKQLVAQFGRYSSDDKGSFIQHVLEKARAERQ